MFASRLRGYRLQWIRMFAIPIPKSESEHSVTRKKFHDLRGPGPYHLSMFEVNFAWIRFCIL